MPDIVFVKTRYNYDSYVDFWSLVKLSGFDTCFVDEVDISREAAYIVTPMNGEWRPHIDNQLGKVRRAQLILWNLERPAGSGGMTGYIRSCEELRYGRYVDDIWVSDRRLADESRNTFVILGSDVGLAEPFDPSHEKRFDFIHLSYVVPRRGAVYSLFPSEKIAPNCWPPHRHDMLLLSKFALNIHQDDFPFQEPLRFALFAAYGLPILTESIRDSYPWSEEYMIYNSYQGIDQHLRQMLNDDYGRWREFGLRARERMCVEFNFKKLVLEKVG